MNRSLDRSVARGLCAMVSGVVACAVGTSVYAQPEPAQTASGLKNVEFLEQFAATRGFTHGTPKSISITPDGSAVFFLRSGPRSFVQDLFVVDVASGQESVFLTADKILAGQEEKLTAEELARRERMRMASRGIASFSLSKGGQRVLVPLSGRLFVIERDGAMAGAMKELKPGAGSVDGGAAFPIDPQFSPDATKVACVRDGDLYVTDIASGVETRLTTKPGATITNGLAEFVAQEEMDRFHGYWWSPDSTQIVYQQTDTAGMETFHIADAMHPEAEPNAWPYPRPGKKNASVRLFVVPSNGGGGGTAKEIAWDHAKYEYLVNVQWPKNGPLNLLVMNREQTEWTLLEADPSTGATKELLKEQDAAWLNIEQKSPYWLKDGSGFLWMTEKSGEWALEHRDRAGDRKSVVSESLRAGGSPAGLQRLVRVGKEMRQITVVASPTPTESHIYVIPEPGTDAQLPAIQMTRGERGVHDHVIADESPVFVWSKSTLRGEVAWMVVDPRGDTKPVQLSLTRESPPWTPNLELTTCGSTPQRTFNAAILRPRDFDKTKKYPVIVNVYGGPHAKTVIANPGRYYLQQWIADQGFIVVSIDGRGTPHRGRDWEREIKGDLIGPALEDQVDGLKSLGEKFPEMDMAHVGIYGWSFGGYFSAMAAMQRPDIFHAGCAGAPVCDWLDYDTCYTERYLGVPTPPVENDPIYKKSSVLTYCKDLRVPLLIIHGTADDNVYFMHALKMMNELFRAGKSDLVDFLPLSGFTHMVPDPVVTTRLYSRVAMFFKTHLGEPSDLHAK